LLWLVGSLISNLHARSASFRSNNIFARRYIFGRDRLDGMGRRRASAELPGIPRGRPRVKDASRSNLGIRENDEVKERSGEEDHLDADRPHFPEASTTVGKGRAVLESGYTFTQKGDSFLSHSGPEALLRVGMSWG
jgi:hypothetical protein